MKKLVQIAFAVLLSGHLLAAQNSKVEKWNFYELSLLGPTAGNPFIGIEFGAVFTQGDRTFEPEGFYEGNGTFKIQFMPDKKGVWTYNCQALNGKERRVK